MTFLNLTFAKVFARELVRDLVGAIHPESSLSNHLEAAMEWLSLAQDQAKDNGVSAGFGRTGWRPSYPETTGYIIPTFIDYFHLTGKATFLERAKKMGEYELGIQLESGAIPCGFKNRNCPCIFDTGQVIFGWLTLFNELGDVKYLDAARRAGDWLLSIQGEDGSWGKDGYMRCPRTYHARTTWAVVMLGQVADQPHYLQAARLNLEWVLANQKPNGFFLQAELRRHAHPVTHTIAYTIDGLLESGIALKDSTFITAAQRAADALLSRQLNDGSVYGKFDLNWEPKTRTRCLTGCVQLSINWLRLYSITGDTKYLRAAQRSNAFVRRTQDLKTKDPVRGAIKGSFPFYGEYERFVYPNWATKFFADAHMMELRLTSRG